MGKFKNRIPELLIEKERWDKKRYSQKDTAVSRFMRHETLGNITYAVQS